MTVKIKIEPKEVERAELESARKKGTGSFFLDILGAPLLKRPALSESVAKYRQALTKADITAGEHAAKLPGLGRIFHEEIKTPVKSVGGFEVSKVENVKRLTAPLVKAQKFLVPIFAYEGLRRIMGGGDKAEENRKAATMTRDEQAVMLKSAALIEKLGSERAWLIDQLALALHEKQARTLAGEMADKGLIAHSEMDKKAIELAKEDDLGIVKKAVDLTQSGFGMGKVEKTASVEGAENGEMDPMTEYLVGFINGR